MAVGVLVGIDVAVGVDDREAVVKLLVELGLEEVPSLATAYHSYWVAAINPDQLMLAADPEATFVAVPTSVKSGDNMPV